MNNIEVWAALTNFDWLGEINFEVELGDSELLLRRQDLSLQISYISDGCLEVIFNYQGTSFRTHRQPQDLNDLFKELIVAIPEYLYQVRNESKTWMGSTSDSSDLLAFFQKDISSLQLALMDYLHQAKIFFVYGIDEMRNWKASFDDERCYLYPIFNQDLYEPKR